MNPIGLQLRAALTFCAQTSVAWRNRVIQTLTSISRPLQSPFYRLAAVISGIFNTTNLVGFLNPDQNHCAINSFAIALFHTAPHVDIPSDGEDDELQRWCQELLTTSASLKEAQDELSTLKTKETEIATQIGQTLRTKDKIQADITQTWDHYSLGSINQDEYDDNLTLYHDELSKWNELELNQQQAERYQTRINEHTENIENTRKLIEDRRKSLILARETLLVLRREQKTDLTPAHASAFGACHPNRDRLGHIKPLYEGLPDAVSKDLAEHENTATILREALNNPNWKVIRLGGGHHWQALVREDAHNDRVTLVNDYWIQSNYMTIDAIYEKWSKAKTWRTSQLTFYSTLP